MAELSIAELADMRRTSQLLQPESWSLVHPTEVSTSEGTTDTWAVTASGMTGARLMPASPQASELILAGRPGSVSAWSIALPAGEDPQPQDRLIIGAALAVAASVVWEVDGVAVYRRVFEVVGDTAGHTWETAVKVDAVEVQ